VGHVAHFNGRAFSNRRTGWAAAGKVAFVVGALLFVAGYLAAFTLLGAVLWFAGAIIGVAGLVTWLMQYRAAWVPLACLVLILLILVVSGIAQVLG